MISPMPYRNNAGIMMQLGFSVLIAVLGFTCLVIGGARRNELFASKRELRESADVFEYKDNLELFKLVREYQLTNYSCDENNPPILGIKGFFTNEIDEVRVFDQDALLIGFYSPKDDRFDFQPHSKCKV